MHYTLCNERKEIAALFTRVFGAAEGEQEGLLIGTLAAELAASIDHKDIYCFGAYAHQTLVGAIFFTRLRVTQPIILHMLAPVAINVDHQHQGIGQALIQHGLDHLKHHAVDTAVTYGDPSFYAKVGFTPLSENVIPAPFKLSRPIGWQACPLQMNTIPTVHERPACVHAFNNPVYW